jgi:CheY-like chemotaxis protein
VPATLATERQLLFEAMRAARDGDRGLARSLLAEYTQETPDDPLGWLWRAGVAHTPELALIWLGELLERYPDHRAGRRAYSVVRLQSAVAACRAGDRATARQLFTDATTDDPANVFAWLELARLASTPAEKRACLSRVVELDSSHERALAALAKLDLESPDDCVDFADVGGSEPASQPISVILRNTRGSNSGEKPSAERAAASEERGTQRGRTLVLAQDRDLGAVLRRELFARHLEASCVSDENEFLAAVREHGAPDLMLFEADMTTVDTFDLCRRLRQDAGLLKVPIVLLARRNGLFSRLRALLAGFSATLGLPLTTAALDRVLANHLTSEPASGGNRA